MRSMGKPAASFLSRNFLEIFMFRLLLHNNRFWFGTSLDLVVRDKNFFVAWTHYLE